MKPHIKKIIIAGVLLLMVLVTVLLIGNGFNVAKLKQFPGTFMGDYHLHYRFIVSYSLATILLIGFAVLLVIRVIQKRLNKGPEVNPEGSLDNSLEGGEWKPGVTYLLIGLLIVLLFWAPYFFRGQETHVKIFDNLDCHIAHTKVLAESGKAFSLNPNTHLDQFLNGIRLSGVDSGYNILTWLFILFPPFIAFALNDLLVRLIAYFGMILLLKRFVLKQDALQNGDQGTQVWHFRWIIIGTAVCFSLLPFYPAGGISIAGIPLLLYCFLNILKAEGKFVHYAVIFIFPFYSKLALAGFFIAVALAVILVIDMIRKKRLNVPYTLALALLTVVYIFTHFHLLYSYFDPTFLSYREEIAAIGVPTADALSNSLWNFVFDRINIVGAQHLFVMATAAIAVWIAVILKVKTKLLPLLIGLTVLTSLMWGFKYWEPIIGLRDSLPLVNAFDMSRFYWFNPFLWYIIFALALAVIARLKRGPVFVYALLICQLLLLFTNYNWEYRYSLGIRHSFAGSYLPYSLSYREYYAEDLYKEVADYIGKPQDSYRVVSLGLPPAVAQYNGFYTLDTYTDLYSLDYKKKFRRIMRKELEKDETLAWKFDKNAKRCYLLIKEIHGRKEIRGLVFARGLTKYERKYKIRDLDLDIDALKELGGEYIFSALEIVNHQENGLAFEKVFDSPRFPWRVYLYRVL